MNASQKQDRSQYRRQSSPGWVGRILCEAKSSAHAGVVICFCKNLGPVELSFQNGDLLGFTAPDTGELTPQDLSASQLLSMASKELDSYEPVQIELNSTELFSADMTSVYDHFEYETASKTFSDDWSSPFKIAEASETARAWLAQRSIGLKQRSADWTFFRPDETLESLMQRVPDAQQAIEDLYVFWLLGCIGFNEQPLNWLDSNEANLPIQDSASASASASTITTETGFETDSDSYPIDALTAKPIEHNFNQNSVQKPTKENLPPQTIEAIEATWQSFQAAQDHECLGIQASSSQSDITNSFRKFASQYHIDRYAKYDVDASLKTKIGEVYARISAAYQKLSNQALSKQYFDALSMREQGIPTDVNVLLEADQHFNDATNALNSNQIDQAFTAVCKALELNRAEALYQAYCGWIGFLYLKEETSQNQTIDWNPEDYITEALRLDPKLAQTHYFKGLMHKLDQQWDESIGALRQALTCDPHHQQAKSELTHVRRLKAKQPASQSAKKKKGWFSR